MDWHPRRLSLRKNPPQRREIFSMTGPCVKCRQMDEGLININFGLKELINCRIEWLCYCTHSIQSVFIPQHQSESQKGLSVANCCHQVQEHSRPWKLVHIDTEIPHPGMRISYKQAMFLNVKPIAFCSQLIHEIKPSEHFTCQHIK